MSDILILGPQYRAPNLRDALARVGLAGPAVTITAGWQEREGELAALQDHLGEPVRDLRLYERAEAVFVQDPELHDAYRQRQNGLRRLQELYRLRLAHAKAAARAMMQESGDSEPVRSARRSAVAGLRRLDAEHLRDIERVHTRFEAHWSASRRPVLARQQAELSHLIETAQVVCIAGGHVAVLLNRMRLFGLARLLRRKPVVAWSAGAMALADRVVLFHDHPPQGAGDAELFEAGLGFVHGAVFLPHAATRIALDDAGRVALLAMRFSPANCYTLDDGSLLYWHRGRLRWATESQRLTRAGGTSPAGATA